MVLDCGVPINEHLVGFETEVVAAHAEQRHLDLGSGFSEHTFTFRVG